MIQDLFEDPFLRERILPLIYWPPNGSGVRNTAYLNAPSDSTLELLDWRSNCVACGEAYQPCRLRDTRPPEDRRTEKRGFTLAVAHPLTGPKPGCAKGKAATAARKRLQALTDHRRYPLDPAPAPPAPTQGGFPI